MYTKRVFVVYLKFRFTEYAVFYLVTQYLRAIEGQKGKGTLVEEKEKLKNLYYILLYYFEKNKTKNCFHDTFLKSRN